MQKLPNCAIKTKDKTENHKRQTSCKDSLLMLCHSAAIALVQYTEAHYEDRCILIDGQ